MKVLLINGSPNEEGCTYTALKEVEKELHASNIETEILYLGKQPMQGCTACRYCKKTNRCIFDDEVNNILDRAAEFDGIVLGSPVYFSQASGTLTAFLDRLFYAANGAFNNKVAASVVSCRRGGASAAFDQLNKYITYTNMVIATSQYWNQVHGNTPSEVKLDFEGLQTMRTLGKNIVWLLKCIDCARKNGIEYPEYEEKVATNFIR